MVLQNSQLIIMHQNIQCLRNKPLQIEGFLAGLTNRPNLILFTEHWLERDEAPYIKISGYRMEALYARSEIKHGGVCIFCDEKSHFENEETISEESVEGVLEMAAVFDGKLKVIVLCLYRRGLGNYELFLERLEQVLNYIHNKYPKYKIIIAGDFNLNFFNRQDLRIKRLLDLFNTYNLEQCIFNATRETNNTATLIDNIFSNLKGKCIAFVLASALSDHHAQIISLKVAHNQKAEHKYMYKRVFPKSKLAYFRQEFEQIDWTLLYNIDDANVAYSVFINAFQNLFNRIFVKKKVQINKTSNDWITAGIKISCRKKRMYYFQKKNGYISSQFYERYCKTLKQVIILAKKLSNKKFLDTADNKVRATWQLVRNITVNKDGNSTTLNNFKVKYPDPSKTVNNLNKYFVNACLNANVSDQNVFPCKRSVNSCYLIPTNYHEVVSVIKNLKNKKSTGDDEVPISVMKEVCYSLSKPLSHIINLCFSTGIYPTLLKNALVRAIHKKGDRDKEENYRPISLLSNIGKVFEKIINDRIINFLDRNLILTPFQNGFKKGRSTVRAIYQALSKIVDSLNDKKVTLAMCVDLSKAFDSVDHRILCNGLEACGIRGNALNLIKSYLAHRTQQVVECDDWGRPVTSDRVGVARGVPQGSILGPLLYILYTNQLPDVTGEYTVLYADDTTLIFSEEDSEATLTHIQNACATLDAYFSSRGLLLNVAKTQCVLFGSRGENTLTFNYNSNEIQTTDNVSFLGVSIDRRLDWRVHVQSVAASMSKYCYALRMIAENVGVEAAKTAYHAYIQSRIRYGIIFWGNSPEIDRIMVLQKRCMRCIFNMKPLESCRDVFVVNGILTFVALYILDSFMFVQNNPDLFEESRSAHNYVTRSKADLVSDKYNFTYLQKNVHYTIIKIYNHFSESVRSLPVKKAKLAVIKYLKAKAYYRLSDFLNDDTVSI